MVFAQSTERNERISSLLSAVFLRTVRSDYTKAAAQAFPSSIERLDYSYSLSHATELGAPSKEDTGSQVSVPVVLFIQQEVRSGLQDRDDILDLLLSIKHAVGRTAVACAELFTTGSYEHDLRSLRGILNLLHPQTPLFVIESSVTAPWVQEVVVAERITVNIRGMVTLCSRQQKLPQLLTNAHSDYPRLLLAVPQRGDDDIQNDLCKACKSNPNVIAVSLPLSLGLTSTKPGEQQYCAATRLWGARTVVKFIQAVSVTTSDNSNTHTIRSKSPVKDCNNIQRRPSHLSWKLRASRL
jgi:hypothetical protein